VIASDPEFSLSHMMLAGNFLAKGMWGEAIESSQKFVDLSGGSVLALSLLGAAYGSAGRKDEAFKILERMDDLSKDRYVGPIFRAIVWVGLGEKNNALDDLEKAFEGRESFIAWLNVWPIFDSLRPEPRFKELVKKLNLDS
jgi:serine/threonine-protein kinase